MRPLISKKVKLIHLPKLNQRRVRSRALMALKRWLRMVTVARIRPRRRKVNAMAGRKLSISHDRKTKY